MAESKPKVWVDGPYALISASRSGAAAGKKVAGARAMAGDMTILHNCFLRGINSIYLQCGNVATKGSTKDKLDLANFAYQWAEWVDEHHRFEEEDLFPRINELAGVPGIMDGNVNEHAQFHDGLIKFEEYLNKVKEEKEELSAETMKSIIESFMPALQSHLESEIDTLVSLEKYDDKVDWFKEYNATVDKMVKGLMAQSEYRIKIFPLGLILHDKSFEGGVWGSFPPVPWVFMLALRWLFVGKQADWWRFAGCDATSYPKDLPFS